MRRAVLSPADVLSDAVAVLRYADSKLEDLLVADLLATIRNEMVRENAVEVRHPDGRQVVVSSGYVVNLPSDADFRREDWTAALTLARAVTGHAAPEETP